jgi:hypothetical protein
MEATPMTFLERLRTRQGLIYLALVLAGILLAVYLLVGRPAPVEATHYVNRAHPQCLDSAEGGTPERPYCTVRFAATTERSAGDVVAISAGRYGEGPFNFTKHGVTWKGVGSVTLGHFFDLDDTTAVPVEGLPDVYAIPYVVPDGKDSAGIFQTHYDPILVDDPNQTAFTLVETDGPLRLKPVTNDADFTHQGTVRYVEGRYLIHPYTNTKPPAADFVIAFQGGLEVDADDNVFEDLTISFTGAYNTLVPMGDDNVYRRLKFQVTPLSIKGNRFRSEDVSISHVLEQGDKFNFHDSGAGTAVMVSGAYHTLMRTTAFHSWNASISLERANNTLVDGAIMHGAPNHCGVGTVAATGWANTFRNFVAFNCQDYLYWSTNEGDAIGSLLVEHMTVMGGITFQTMDHVPVNGPITIRNAIFGGTINFAWKSDTYDPAMCQYEPTMVIEHSVMASDATIHRCSDGKDYPLQTYMDQCATGTFTNCITFRDNRIIPPTEWAKVIKGGNWYEHLGDMWDARLVEGSPAIGLALPGASQDVIGTPRPQGGTADAGAYEWKP